MAKKRNETLALLEEQTVLSEERTILSKERTILAFMQTGIALIGIGLVVINLLTNLPSQVVGWILILFGFLEIIESYRRLRKYMQRMGQMKKKWGKEVI